MFAKLIIKMISLKCIEKHFVYSKRKYGMPTTDESTDMYLRLLIHVH